MTQFTIWYCHPFAASPTRGKKPARPYFISQALNQLGHRAVVITSAFEHISGLKVKCVKDYLIERDEGVDFVWLNTPEYRSNGLARVYNMIVYARKLKRSYKKLISAIGAPDIIICSSPHPFHYNTCLKIAKNYNAKLIAEVRDLWPLSLIEILGVRKYHPLCLWLAHLEKKMCQTADAVVSLLNHADKYLVRKGLSQNKFYWVPNGYQPLIGNDGSVHLDQDYQKIKHLKQRGKFIIGYTGAHGKPNNLEILCQAIAELGEYPVHLCLMGDGNIKQQLIGKYGTVENIDFFRSKPRAQMSAYQALFDFGYWSLVDCQLFAYGLSPNKIYEYMYNKLPILSSQFPKVDPVDHAQCGVFFENNSVVALKQAIIKAMNLPQVQRMAMGKRAQQEIKANYLYPHLAEKYAKVIEIVAGL